jgi:signal transduction histidine kinase
MDSKTTISNGDQKLRSLTEPQTKTNNKLLFDAIESLPHSFYIIDVKNYRVKFANSATKVFGDIKETTTCYELTHNRKTPCNGKEHGCPLKEVKSTKKPIAMEHIHFDNHGRPRNYELHGYPIFDNDGNVIQMIESSLDITERKKVEEESKRIQKDLEKRVKIHTTELEKANESLRKEIDERINTEQQLLNYQQRLRSLASELTLTEEYHRRKVASDLHDGIGQTLALVKIKLSKILNDNPAKDNSEQLKEILGLTEGVIQDTRNLTFQLSPPILYELGFKAALEWLVENIQEQYGFIVHLHGDTQEKNLDENISIVLFRATREILINIAKHANAKNVDLLISKNNSFIEIKVIDDGEGFDVESDPAYEKKGGYGLFSIRERLNPLGGCLVIDSRIGEGTRVLIKVPLKIMFPENGKYYVY